MPVDAGSAYSLDGLRKVLGLIDAVKQNGNPDLRFLRLLINRADRRTSISRVIIGDLNERFGPEQVFKTVVPLGTAFQQAEYANETVFKRFRSCKGAIAYRQLAREFLSIFSEEQTNGT
ncbi:unnamed protein product [marine sediment metagenome]|uniref:CobQ/CobB/MinD/ParA nucleotide binding domain-containing protein n=1 Tax=marine sediment metagenome TaxID=412755 RepID=X0U782_9ZZZZ